MLRPYASGRVDAVASMQVPVRATSSRSRRCHPGVLGVSVRLTFDSEGTTGGLIRSPPLGSEVTISCPVPCCLPKIGSSRPCAIWNKSSSWSMRLLDDASELDGFLRRPRWQAGTLPAAISIREISLRGRALARMYAAFALPARSQWSA